MKYMLLIGLLYLNAFAQSHYENYNLTRDTLLQDQYRELIKDQLTTDIDTLETKKYYENGNLLSVTNVKSMTKLIFRKDGTLRFRFTFKAHGFGYVHHGKYIKYNKNADKQFVIEFKDGIFVFSEVYDEGDVTRWYLINDLCIGKDADGDVIYYGAPTTNKYKSLVSGTCKQ